MNMKVTDLNPLSVPSVKPGIAATRPTQTDATSKTNSQTEVSTQVSLAPATQSAFGSRAEKIAELKGVVSSGSYKPNSQSISEKLVSGALSRPE